MGLGKSLQVVALLHMLLTNPLLNNASWKNYTPIERVLLVVPVNTLENWKTEFKKWVEEDDTVPNFRVTCMNDQTNAMQKFDEADQWFKEGGVLLISSPTFASICKSCKDDTGIKARTYTEAFISPGPESKCFQW